MSAPKPALVALRDEREKTLKALTEAFASDLFDVDEYERRVDSAHRATTCEALVALRADVSLDVHEDTSASNQAMVKRSSAETEALVAMQPKSKWAVAIMGGVERKGAWRVPKKIKVAAIMGGAQFDFREAIFAPGVHELKIFACMGGVEIIVPPDLSVECDGMGIMGGFEIVDRVSPTPDPSQPVLRITGVALMGGVDVQTRMIAETARDARRRQKREAKALRKAARRGQLPGKSE